MAEGKLDPFIQKYGNTCSKWNRDPVKLSVQELWMALLHLVSFGDWEIDHESGALYAPGRSAGGGGLDYLRRLGRESRGIHLLGFTNQDLGEGATVYNDLSTMQKAIDKKYQEWRTRQAFEEKEGAGAGASNINYIDQFAKAFLSNRLSSLYVSNWQLVRINKIFPTSYHPGEFAAAGPAGPGGPAAAAIGGVKYELTFIGEDGYEFSWLFSPTDVLYFCDYDVKQTGDEEKKFYKMRLYPEEKTMVCDDPFQKIGYVELPKKVTLRQIINLIQHELTRPGIPEKKRWKKDSSSNKWTAIDKKNGGLYIRWVPGFKGGIPATDSTDPRDKYGVRLIGIENINRREDLWKLQFILKSREGYFSTPSYYVYGSSDMELQRCLPRTT